MVNEILYCELMLEENQSGWRRLRLASFSLIKKVNQETDSDFNSLTVTVCVELGCTYLHMQMKHQHVIWWNWSETCKHVLRVCFQRYGALASPRMLTRPRSFNSLPGISISVDPRDCVCAYECEKDGNVNGVHGNESLCKHLQRKTTDDKSECPWVRREQKH